VIVLLQRYRVDLCFGAQGQQSTQFTGEEEAAIHFTPEQGLHTETVAGQEEGVIFRIVDGQGEEAVEVVQEGRALQREQAQYDLRVGMAAEGVARGFKPARSSWKLNTSPLKAMV
jgi:hypothetical protein